MRTLSKEVLFYFMDIVTRHAYALVMVLHRTHRTNRTSIEAEVRNIYIYIYVGTKCVIPIVFRFGIENLCNVFVAI